MSAVPGQAVQETEVVEGLISEIRQKALDKWQVMVAVEGQQYPRGLWSADQGLVMQLYPFLGQHMGFNCRVSHWQANDGSPRRSLWILGTGPAATAASPEVSPSPPQAPVQPSAPAATAGHVVTVTQDIKEKRIHRQTATKVAAFMLPHLPPEQRTMDNLLVISEKLVGYYEQGLGVTPSYDGDPGPQGMPEDEYGEPGW